jgi:hypothetical protein
MATPFEQAQQAVAEGRLISPVVSTLEGKVDYFGYQLAVHVMYLSLMAKGIKNKQVKLKDLREYYGLKGRTAVDALPQLKAIQADYRAKFKASK